MLFTRRSPSFLDLNYKHTSILQLHSSSTYIVPLDRYRLLIQLSFQQRYKIKNKNLERWSETQNTAV